MFARNQSAAALNVLRIVFPVGESVRGRAARAAVELGPELERPNTAGKVTGTDIIAAKIGVVSIVRDIHVAREDGGAVIKAGVNHDVRLVVARARQEVGGLFGRVIGKPKIGVAIAGVDFQATEAVNQVNVDHARDRVRAVVGRGTVFQDVDVIDQPKRERVEVHRVAGETNVGETTAILQDESLLRSDAAQVDARAAVTTVGVVFVHARSGGRRDLLNQIRGTAHTKAGDVVAAISIDRIRPDFFRGRNIRTGDDDSLDFGLGPGSRGANIGAGGGSCRGRRRRLRESV